jgi:hypothetical protein
VDRVGVKMSLQEPFILMGMGGLFIFLGVGAIIWGKTEEKRYYNALSTRSDLREFLDHSPRRPGHGALEMGGGIAIAIGVPLLVMGGVFLLLG